MQETYFLHPWDRKNKDIVLNYIYNILDKDERVLLCVSYFTHKEIGEKILNRLEQWKETKLIINQSDIFRPENNWEIELVFSKALHLILTKSQWGDIKILGSDFNKYSSMHHKFIIGDYRVWFWSMNYTTNSLENNFENITFSDHIQTVSRFINEFNYLWKLSPELWTSWDWIRVFRCPSCKEEHSIDFESWGTFCTVCNQSFNLNIK